MRSLEIKWLAMRGRYIAALDTSGLWRFYQVMPEGQVVEVSARFNKAWRRKIAKLFWNDMKGIV